MTGKEINTMKNKDKIKQLNCFEPLEKRTSKIEEAIIELNNHTHMGVI